MLWDSRKARSDGAAVAVAPGVNDGPTFPTKALRKFLASLTSREAPVLLDLGPVVGSNITFFGERLGCKIIVEDLFADLNRHSRNADTPFAELLSSRLRHEPASVDGILCWNFFDYLEPAAAQVLGAALTKLVRPDGAVLGFFATLPASDSRFTKYVILNEDTLRQQSYGDAGRKLRAVQNRDIIRLFDGLKVSESFLLKTNVREFLFRRPAAAQQ